MQSKTSVPAGLRVLVVEDEPLVAMALVDDLEAAGAIVVGPAASVDGALTLIERHDVDAAVLDIKLEGCLVFPVADALAARGVPFIFTSGYDAGIVPAHYAHVPTCEKPASMAMVVAMIAGLARKAG